ncbi:MAG: succinyl-diaminopimelate desuccinylase [Actinomycetota bacterium]|nr:MAG: succinyl-diaminopimelate desuccinylase [Actinomycetota bacterium]
MGTDLSALCQSMVAIPSVSHDEEKIADFVASHLAGIASLDLLRIGNNIVARSSFGRSSRVVVAGHLDTVPPDDNQVLRVENRRIYGLGSADMKAGLAVMLGLAELVESFLVDLTLVFYVCEEVASVFSGLLEIEHADPELLQSDAAVLMEPTSNRIEAGCQGTMRIRVGLAGKRAHTARPWAGVNAIHRLGDLINRIAHAELDNPIVDGLQFREAMQVVGVSGGIANNVVPDLASVTVNYRFAPNKGIDAAFQSVKSLLADLVDRDRGDDIVLEEGVLGASPNLGDPFIMKLLAATNKMPEAKLGWTDAAFFSSRGIPATNFGPGNPLLAHSRDEFVELSEIEAAFGIMKRALGS